MNLASAFWHIYVVCCGLVAASSHANKTSSSTGATVFPHVFFNSSTGRPVLAVTTTAQSSLTAGRTWTTLGLASYVLQGLGISLPGSTLSDAASTRASLKAPASLAPQGSSSLSHAISSAMNSTNGTVTGLATTTPSLSSMASPLAPTGNGSAYARQCNAEWQDWSSTWSAIPLYTTVSTSFWDYTYWSAEVTTLGGCDTWSRLVGSFTPTVSLVSAHIASP
jgi:hypothetical protein